jgi:HK97 family phage prohead protease
MTTTFEATAQRPGPDGNAEREHLSSVRLQLRHDAVMVSGMKGGPYTAIEGMAVPYGRDADIGWFVEQHAFGSFERSTKAGAGRSAPLLLWHDREAFPIGHAEKWTHQADGMVGVWKLNDTERAQEAARLAERGDLVGLSIGFQPIRSEWELADDWAPELGADHKDRVTRLESRLLEVSMTPAPAFAEAKVASVRDATVYTREARRPFLPTAEVDAWRAWRSSLTA